MLREKLDEKRERRKLKKRIKIREERGKWRRKHKIQEKRAYKIATENAKEKKTIYKRTREIRRLLTLNFAISINKRLDAWHTVVHPDTKTKSNAWIQQLMCILNLPKYNTQRKKDGRETPSHLLKKGGKKEIDSLICYVESSQGKGRETDKKERKKKKKKRNVDWQDLEGATKVRLKKNSQ